MLAMLLFIMRNNSGPCKACHPSCLQIHRLLQPEMVVAGSLPPSSIHTSREDGLIDNVIRYMLPTDSNIVGNSFEPNILKNLHQVWVRPSTIQKSHWPLACHTPGGPDVKPFQKVSNLTGTNSTSCFQTVGSIARLLCKICRMHGEMHFLTLSCKRVSTRWHAPF
jgi:hypothetical protein